MRSTDSDDPWGDEGDGVAPAAPNSDDVEQPEQDDG
jgi:hypothetical protein